MKKERDHLFNASLIIASSTLLSRILGFVRDIMIVWLLGTSFFSDAFFAAFRVPETFRKLCAEGSLSSSFIPLFSKNIDDRIKLNNIAGSLFRSTIILLIPAVILLIVFSPEFIKIFAGGFFKNPEKFQLTVLLSQIMFPYLFFVSLSAISMGFLNSLNHFTSPALSSVLLNLTIISFISVAYLTAENPVVYIAVGVVAGGLLQFLIQVPFLKQNGFTFRTIIKKDNINISKVISNSFNSTLGISLSQMNMLTGTIVATFLVQGSVTYLYIADRLVQFPLSVLGTSLSSAFFPSIARETVNDEIKKLYMSCVKLILFVIIPAMVGLILIREPVISILFLGKFTPPEIKDISQVLLFYSISMWVWGVTRITVSVYYSLEDNKTPAIISSISMILNIIFAISLVFHLGVSGIALASSISGSINLTVLVLLLGKKIKIDYINILSSSCKTIFNSVIMGAIVYTALNKIYFTDVLILQIFYIFLIILIGIMVYAICSYFTKSSELYILIKHIKGNKKDE
ncbi:MAG: murein biosynthesis integral membrane protein MurJ [Desulfobacterales bacterium]|nr:murein biosynthesis integral membrane protein MurJ [Desulfobacterales bacterium]